MQLEVRLFGGLAELMGARRLTVALPGDTARVAELRTALTGQHPALAPHLARTAVAVDLEVAGDDTVVATHSEVALLPPVAGGAETPTVVTGLRQPPFDVDATITRVSGPDTGAAVTFLGTVRDHAPDLDTHVVGLEYSAYEAMAERVLADVAERVAAAHPSVTGLALLHALGDLAVGDHTILIVAVAPHRHAAFAACAAALEAVKDEVPVFKRERTVDGGHRWVGLTDEV